MAGAYINDGSVSYGSRIIKITGSAAGNYVANDIEVTRPSTVIEVFDEIGEPSKQVFIPAWVVGTCTLQLSGSNPQIPSPGVSSFATTFSGSAETFYINEVGQPEGQFTDKVLRISFRKKVA